MLKMFVGSLLLLSMASSCVLSPASLQMLVAPWQAHRFDELEAADRLAGAIRFETTNDQLAQPNTAAFLGLHAYLKTVFPLVHATLSVEKVNALSLLYTWQGEDSRLEPVLLIAHQDVVPVESPQLWDHPPFAGTIQEGVLYGRGTLDNKAGVVGILEAAEQLIAAGFRPRRTLYFAFGHDEEIMGTRGAEQIAQQLAARGVRCAFVVDEGPPVTAGLAPGIDKAVAFIGTSTKGNLYMRLQTRGAGGHASIAERETPISTLSRAIVRLHAHEFPRSLPVALREGLRFLAPEAPFVSRIAFANSWLFEAQIIDELQKSPISRALTTVTVSTNMISGGDKDATVPTSAEAVVAVGFVPPHSVDGVIETLRKVINDDSVVLTLVEFPDNHRAHAYEAVSASPTDGWEFQVLQKTVHEVFPDVLVASTLVPNGSDAKHYLNAKVAKHAYFFNPMEVPSELLRAVHGTNERVPVSSYVNSIRYYRRLIENLEKPLDGRVGRGRQSGGSSVGTSSATE